MPRELRVILAALAQMKKRVHGHKRPHETAPEETCCPWGSVDCSRWACEKELYRTAPAHRAALARL